MVFLINLIPYQGIFRLIEVERRISNPHKFHLSIIKVETKKIENFNKWNDEISKLMLKWMLYSYMISIVGQFAYI